MSKRLFTPIACCGLALVLAVSAFATSAPSPSTNDAATDANITRLTTNLLEISQYSQHPLDKAMASKFLDRYLDALDSKHLLFLQSDVDAFAPVRATLAQALDSTGDTTAARVIFDCYLKRLNQRSAYVSNLLKSTKFDFSGNELYSFDRDNAPRPMDLNAAEALWGQQLRAEYLQEKLNDKKSDEIVKTLDHRYAQLVRTVSELTRDEVLEIYLNTLAHVYDPHSDYMGHEQYDNFSIAMNLSLFGIGATLEAEDGDCKVVSLVPGGPAARSGLIKPGDRIMAVAQGDKEPVNLTSMPPSRAVELIRGPKGSVVQLTIIPAGMEENAPHHVVSLVRDEIKLEDQEAKARIIDLPMDQGQTVRLGVIDLPSFYADVDKHEGTHHSASVDVARLLGKLKDENVHGIVLDLRHNGGGSLDEAIKLTGLFIREGPVVQTRGPKGDIEIGADTDHSIVYDGPLVILTSRYSASASEILAGALQDYGRAIIAGDSTTFGKGTVQEVIPLASIMNQYHLDHSYNPGALKLTIRKFYRPSGASTQLKGVAADIILPSTSEVSGVSESAMKNPLPWDTVPAATYDHLNRVQPYLPTLLSASARRVAADKGFAYLNEQSIQLKESLLKKSVSLNETQRRKEMAENQEKQKKFDEEEIALNAIQPTMYDITLNNLTVPGLPPPVPVSRPVTDPSPKKTALSGDELNKTLGDQTPVRDLILTEAEHILADYVMLMTQQPSST